MPWQRSFRAPGGAQRALASRPVGTAPEFCYDFRLRTTNPLPSQQQLRWSQLRVGLTVLFASVTLFFLVFLMSGITGLFATTVSVKTYFDNAEGLRNG